MQKKAMSKTIEISLSAIVKVFTAIVFFCILLFLLDRYDKNNKRATLNSCVKKIQESTITKDLINMLQATKLDAIEELDIINIKAKIEMLDDEFPEIFYYRMALIIKDELGYRTLSYEMNEFENHQGIPKSIENVIRKINTENTDIIEGNYSSNINANTKRIIFPLWKSEKKSSYLNFRYLESH